MDSLSTNTPGGQRPFWKTPEGLGLVVLAIGAGSLLICKRQSNPTLPECATGSYLPAFGRGLRWGVGVRRLGRSCSRRRLVAG